MAVTISAILRSPSSSSKSASAWHCCSQSHFAFIYRYRAQHTTQQQQPLLCGYYFWLFSWSIFLRFHFTFSSLLPSALETETVCSHSTTWRRSSGGGPVDQIILYAVAVAVVVNYNKRLGRTQSRRRTCLWVYRPSRRRRRPHDCVYIFIFSRIFILPFASFFTFRTFEYTIFLITALWPPLFFPLFRVQQKTQNLYTNAALDDFTLWLRFLRQISIITKLLFSLFRKTQATTGLVLWYFVTSFLFQTPSSSTTTARAPLAARDCDFFLSFSWMAKEAVVPSSAAATTVYNSSIHTKRKRTHFSLLLSLSLYAMFQLRLRRCLLPNHLFLEQSE